MTTVGARTPDPRAAAARVPHAPVRAAPPGRMLDHPTDRPVLVALVALVVAVHATAHHAGIAVGMDVATQFIPWFGWMGEQLASGQIPQWNPTVFSGMPSAGDPLSGWGYLPAMLPFALLDLGAATQTFLVVQLALVATGTYLLGRALRLSVAGALVAALAATFSGFVFQRNVCCVAFVSVEAWIPWLLLGIDRALATTGARRVGAWALAALAATQVAGGWLGQGTLYVLLLAALWLTGRALSGPGTWRARARRLAVNAAALAVVGAGLSASVVWPRLQVNPATNLAGGYPGQSLTSWHGGWWPAEWAALVDPGIWYLGATPLALALAALVVARHQRVTWLCAGIAAVALLLSLPTVTPVNAPLFLAPGLDRVLTHAPQRAVVMLVPMVALLAGLVVTHLRVSRIAPWIVALAAIVIVSSDLAAANVIAFQQALDATRNPDLFRRIDPDTFYEPSGAGRFLQRQRDRGEIGRYAAFTPIARPDGSVVSASYFFFWHFPSVQSLEAHNEGMLLGLEHVQGYNAVHLARYDDLITAANGRAQDYHVANLFPVAFDRKVFDLLNGRWVVLNRRIDHRDPDLVGEAMATWPEAYLDDEIRVLENPEALPRAWLVYDARPADPGQALDAFTEGGDPRSTAVLEAPVPPLDPDGRGTAIVTDRDTDRLTVDVRTTGDALLVLSEIYHPAWRATVDGRPAPVLATNHALRGVPVPAGAHTVEVTFDRTVIDAGLAVTAATAVVLVASAWWVRRRRSRP